MNKKITSFVLAVCMLLSCVAVGSFSASAAEADETVAAVAEEEVGADYGLSKTIAGAQILQCFNWSYQGIKNNMKKIAEQGFTAIQTSPIQTIKESTQGKTMQGSWWVYYQPSNFKIDTNGQNALGNKSDFTAMCNEAHKYGVKVVVDAVLNHMANAGDNTLSNTIPSDIRNDNGCWHSIYQNTSNWNSRWDITHNCMGGLPDLNTGNPKVQNYEIAFMKECIDCGVDGFRFDGAKHIEVPNDNENASSNFWTRILGETTSYAKSKKGITPYYYGEVLDSTGGGQGVINQYCNLMSITLNKVSNDIRNKVNSRDANGAKRTDYSLDDGSVPSKNAILWNESHDTYADGSSRGQGDATLKKTWAIVGSRADSVAMYMARPNDFGRQIGCADVTAWAAPEVKGVNVFKNYFNGQSEYLSSSGSIVYNERGTSGVMICNLNGGGQVSLKANKMASGTYTDQITGNKFTVSGGTISGQVGSTGVAVVYNAKPAGPSASAEPGTSTYDNTITVTLKVENATSGQYSIDGGSFQSFTNGKTISSVTTLKVNAGSGSETVTYEYTKIDFKAKQRVYFDTKAYNWSNVHAYIYADESTSNAPWPGVQMQSDARTGNLVLDIPEGMENGLVIFNTGEGGADRYPADMEPGLPLDGKTKIFTTGNQLVDYVPQGVDDPTDPYIEPTDPVITPTGKILLGDTNGSGSVTVSDATFVQLHISNQKPLSGDNALAADVDQDGQITVTDATMIQLYLVYKKNSQNHTGEYIGGGNDPYIPPTEPIYTDPTDPPVDPTYPNPDDTKTFLFTNNAGWDQCYVYAFANNTDLSAPWPGDTMAEKTMNDFNEEQFIIKVPAGAEGIVLNNGNGDQTVDITDFNVTGYYTKGERDGQGHLNVYSWRSDDNQLGMRQQKESSSFLFTDNANWGQCYVYAFADGHDLGAAWPGNTMAEQTVNGFGERQFIIKVPAGAQGIVLNNGNGDQTVDITDFNVTGYYTKGDRDGSGHLNIYSWYE